MKVRCMICRHKLLNLKHLIAHLHKHSKTHLCREILKNSFTRVFLKKQKKIYKTIYLHDKVQITYSNNEITIEDESNRDNLIELSINEAHNYKFPIKKKSKKLFELSFRKILKSLNEQTGEFYECHCMEKTNSIDDKSGGDCGEIFYCSFCRDGFASYDDLQLHQNQHQTYYCKLCNQFFDLSQQRDHLHPIRTFVCHVCDCEFLCKDTLKRHLDFHFEQKVLDDVVDMEQNYRLRPINNFTSGDYYTNINNILRFLQSPYDHYYNNNRNVFMKTICDLCYQEVFVADYERHLAVAHFFPPRI